MWRFHNISKLTEISTPASFVAYLGCLGRARPATKMDECAENAKREDVETNLREEWSFTVLVESTYYRFHI